MSTNLDGVTVLRYAHVDRSRDAGGTEQYLGQLDEELLARHRMTILQMHLVNGRSAAVPVEVERRGRGRIIWVPVEVRQERRSARSLPRRLTQFARNLAAMTGKNAGSLSLNVLRYLCVAYGYLWSPEVVLSEALGEFSEVYRVDLMLFHWLSFDIGPLISRARTRGTPYAIIHHFDNDRLRTASSRLWVRDAVAVGGVSNRNVPPEILGKYVNVSDAVDGDFFTPRLARPVARPTGFVVLLPSRIVAGKGHGDLLAATRQLLDAGTKATVVFAGAIVSEAVHTELKRMVSVWDLEERVLFLGRLTSTQLRDWYAASDVVVLPSTSEGLGRVLLEAQAMATPVIAYESGGVPDAFVPGETGFLVGSGDVSALAARIKTLQANPEERLRMGASGRSFVLQHFGVRSLVERHERLYGRLLAHRAPSAAREV